MGVVGDLRAGEKASPSEQKRSVAICVLISSLSEAGMWTNGGGAGLLWLHPSLHRPEKPEKMDSLVEPGKKKENGRGKD